MERLATFLASAGGAALLAGIIALVDRWLDRRAQKKMDLSAQVEDLNKLVGNLITANRTQMYDRIKHLAKKHIAKGYVTVEELEDLAKMHSVYHNELGGNGFLDDLMENVKDLERRVS